MSMNSNFLERKTTANDELAWMPQPIEDASCGSRFPSSSSSNYMQHDTLVFAMERLMLTGAYRTTR
jgi:hypothetical protein